MTAHELTRRLLQMEDKPVVVYNHCDGTWMPVESVEDYVENVDINIGY